MYIYTYILTHWYVIRNCTERTMIKLLETKYDYLQPYGEFFLRDYMPLSV